MSEKHLDHQTTHANTEEGLAELQPWSSLHDLQGACQVRAPSAQLSSSDFLFASCSLVGQCPPQAAAVYCFYNLGNSPSKSCKFYLSQTYEVCLLIDSHKLLSPLLGEIVSILRELFSTVLNLLSIRNPFCS